MKKGKLIAGIIWLIVGTMLLIGLAGFVQKILIAGTEFINELGGMPVEDEVIFTEPTAGPTLLLTEDDFNSEPIVTMEPEELFSIPVEETIEELAQENEKK